MSFFYVFVAPRVNPGTTSTVALLRDGIELVVGSVGDSRAMLCRKGKALKLTVDHTPERKDEKERWGKEKRTASLEFLWTLFDECVSPPLLLKNKENGWFYHLE